MKKMAAILAGGVVLVLGLFVFFSRSAGCDGEVPEPAVANAGPAASLSKPGPRPVARAEASQPAAGEESTLTEEELEKLPKEEQDKAVEAFVARFWASESGASPDTSAQESYISLDLFGRPYMNSISEDQFQKLSPQDQERAMAEIVESCRQTRRQLQDTIAQAQACAVGNDPRRAEAYLISALERGRELSANREGMLLTRLVGIACQKSALNEMTALYTRTGDRGKWQSAEEHLQQMDAEAREIRRTAQQAGQ